MGLFWSAGLFGSYTNFITAIGQIKEQKLLNHLYRYNIQTDYI